MLALLLSRRSRLVEQVISSDHIVDDGALANLLAAELALGAEVAAVVVAEVVVRRDAEGLDAGVDEELSEDRLELRLPALEVVAADERAVLLRKRDAPGHERVLRRAVDERCTLEDRRDGEEGRGRHLVVRCLDRVQEVVRGVVHAREDVGETLRVGCPEDDDLVELLVGFEVADVGAELLEVGLFVVAGEEVVRTGLLVGGDKVWVIDRGEGFDRSHEGDELALEVPGEDLGTLHSRIERKAGDVPPADNEVVGVHGGKDGGQRDVNILAGGGIDTKAESGSTKDRADVVGGLDAFLGAPSDVVGVGEDGSGQGGAVVATKTDHHEAKGRRGVRWLLWTRWTRRREGRQRGEGGLGKTNIPGAGNFAGGSEFKGFEGRVDDVLVAVIDDVLATVVEC